MIEFGLTLMAITATFLLIALVVGGIELVSFIRFKLEYRRDWNLAIIENKLWNNLNELLYTHEEPKPSNRHNIHCPTCGRFSKRVMGLSDVVECKVHGVQVRWKDMPVDWELLPIAHGVSMYDPVPVTAEIAIITSVDTGPIWIGDFEEDVENLLELESIRDR